MNTAEIALGEDLQPVGKFVAKFMAQRYGITLDDWRALPSQVKQARMLEANADIELAMQDAHLVRLFDGVMPRTEFDRLPPVEQATLLTGKGTDQIKLELGQARLLRG